VSGGKEVTVDWRKLRSEELHILFCSQNIIRAIKSRRKRWVGHVAELIRGFWRNVKDVLLGRTKNRWEIDIKMDLKETG
jgi:hypothetical protein